MTVVGVNCTPHEAYPAVVDAGAVLDATPERLRPAHGIELGERLLEFIDEVRRVLARVAPTRIGLLLANPLPPPPSHGRPLTQIDLAVPAGRKRRSRSINSSS